MATPDYKTLLKGSTTWSEEHRCVRITLNHHAYRDGSEYAGARPEPGTWCYYLHLTEEMFAPEDWSQFWLDEQVRDWGITHDYDVLPDLHFHGGCTFYERREGWSKKRKAKVGVIKVGCDYGHSWDRDDGYYHTYDDVFRDAKRSVDTLLELFPNHKTRCGYSGIWDEPGEFYEAINGQTVHKSHAEHFREENGGWRNWLPKLEAQS